MRKNSFMARVAVLALATMAISSFAACKTDEVSANGKASTEASVEVDEAKEALYNDAVKSLQIGNADKSLEAFEAVADYKDAASYIETINKYKEAIAAEEAYDYDKAASLLSECGKLFDSMGRTADYAAVKEMAEKFLAGDLEGAAAAKSNIKTLPKKALTAAVMHAESEAIVKLAGEGNNETVAALLAEVLSKKTWVGENWTEGDAALALESNPAEKALTYGNVTVFFEDVKNNVYYYGVSEEDSVKYFDADGVAME